MASKTPLPEQFLARLKSHRMVALVIVAGSIVIAAASFTDAAKRLVSAFSPQRPEEARVELTRLSLPYTADAFVDAASRGDATAVKLFVAAGMQVDDMPATGQPTTALIEAARHNRTEIVKLLLAAKADPNKRSAYGSALQSAAVAGHKEVVLLLLDRKPSAELVDEAFVSAAYLGRHEMMLLLHQRGARLERVGRAALFDAVSSSHSDEKSAVDSVTWLLQAGVDANGADKERGWTALHYAAYDGHTAVIALLLQRADPNVRDRDGATPLWWAAGVGRHEHARLLLERGADANARHRDGSTPLQRARYNRDDEMVRLLLDKGANESPVASAKP